MTPRTRVLYVIDSLAPGGAETSLAVLAPGLAAHSIELIVQPLTERDGVKEDLEAGGAVVLGVSRRTGRLGNLIQVVRAIRRYQPDLVHTTLFEADLVGRVAAWLTKTPVTSSIVKVPGALEAEGVPRWKLRLAQVLTSTTVGRVRAWHVLTDTIASAATTNLGISADLIHIIPRGRDPMKFPFRASGIDLSLRQRLDIPASAHVILAVARLEYVKGLDQLIAAANRLTLCHPEVVVMIAGKEGREGRALRRLAAAGGADIRFLGHRTDIADLLNTADVFSVPSRQEGICGALIEAMAVGIPAVVADLPTLRDVLGSSTKCGVLVDFSDSNAAAHVFAAILEHPESASAMALEARLRFEREYTLDRASASMARFFRVAGENR